MIAVYLYRHPRILLLVIFVVIASGLSSYFVLPQLEDPVLSRRVGVVTTAFPGATPEKVESLVTVPIEEAFESISSIKQIRSNTLSGISNVVLELNDEVTDVAPVWNSVREKIIDLENHLPEGALSPELDVVPLKAFAAVIAIKYRSDAEENNAAAEIDARLGRVARGFRRQLISIAGTEKVDMFGEVDEELVIEFTPESLVEMETSTGAVAQQVTEELSRQPWGQFEGGAQVMRLERDTLGTPVELIGKTKVRAGQRGETRQLSQVANIQKRLEPLTYQAVIDGESAIVIGVMVDDSYRVEQWFGDFEVVFQDFSASYDRDISFEVLFSQGEHIDQRMRSLMYNLGFGTLAVTIVVLVIMGWRSTLIVSIALPLTALLVLAVMRAFSLPIHQMSVTGLIVALGLLIDNAIVIVDELQSEIKSGQSSSNAISRTIRLFGIPLLGSTITTVLAFLPIATLPGPAGEFVGSIALTVIIAITGSLLLSLTVIPAAYAILSSRVQRKGTSHHGLRIGWIAACYQASLGFMFRYPLLGVILGILLPGVCFYFSQQLPEQFFPSSDRQQIQIELERPVGETLAGTRESVDQAWKVIADNGKILRQYWFIGGSAPTFYYNVVPRRRGTAFYAQAFADLKEGTDTKVLTNELQRVLDAELLDSRVIVRQLEQGPPIDSPIEIRVFGPDSKMLNMLGGEIRRILADSPHIVHTRSDFEETVLRVALDTDESAAVQAGLNALQLSRYIYSSLHGADAGTIYSEDANFPVSVQIAFDEKSQLKQLFGLPIQTGFRRPGPPQQPGGPPDTDWQAITLSSLASAELKSDVGAIVRIDGKRVNEVRAYVPAGLLPSIALKDFQERLDAADFELPTGYSVQYGGEKEQRAHTVRKLISYGVVLFALMVLVLVASLQSFRCAAIIATVGGLATGLGPLALYLGGFPFGFTAIVGTMGLIGVAINDSIVVLAAIRANSLAASGDLTEVVNVVNHCTRHIVATTFTTVVGFLPLIIGGGGFWPPLAICIAGGVGGATLLALYFVPSLYLLVFAKWR